MKSLCFGQNFATGTRHGFHDGEYSLSRKVVMSTHCLILIDTHMYAKVILEDHLMDNLSIDNFKLPKKLQEKPHFHYYRFNLFNCSITITFDFHFLF